MRAALRGARPGGASTMSTTAQPNLLSARDAARALAVAERTLWGLTSPRGPIPCVKIGRSVRYAVSDLQAFIDRQKHGGQPG